MPTIATIATATAAGQVGEDGVRTVLGAAVTYCTYSESCFWEEGKKGNKRWRHFSKLLEKTVQNTKLSKNLRKQPLLFVYTFLQMYGKVRRKHFVCSIMGNVDKLVKTQKSLQKPAIFCQKTLDDWIQGLRLLLSSSRAIPRLHFFF